MNNSRDFISSTLATIVMFIILAILWICGVRCSEVTSSVGVHIPGSDKSIESTFDKFEYRPYGWYIPMPPYYEASIELRNGLIWRELPDNFYSFMAASFETGEYWIKIEDKNHDLNNKEYRVKYEN